MSKEISKEFLDKFSNETRPNRAVMLSFLLQEEIRAMLEFSSSRHYGALDMAIRQLWDVVEILCEVQAEIKAKKDSRLKTTRKEHEPTKEDAAQETANAGSSRDLLQDR